MAMSASLSATLANSINRLRSGLVVLPVELVFTSHSSWPHSPSNSAPKRPVEISVLDSSFNPPTSAHLALANARRPTYGFQDKEKDYDAKLLLLSVRNVDKQLKQGDAIYTQRLEMMVRLAQDAKDTGTHENVAVAIIDEPTFVGKSRLLQKFLKERSKAHAVHQLTFLLGFDTLERFFATKYYGDDEEKMFDALEGFFAPHPLGDGSRIVCARRSPSSYPQSSPVPNEQNPGQSLKKTIEKCFQSRSLPAELVQMIDIGEDVWAVSSSDVRSAVANGDEKWKEMVPGTVKEFIEAEGLYKS